MPERKMNFLETKLKLSKSFGAVCVHDNKYYCFSGSSIVVYDSSFEKITTIKGIKNTYGGIISPDGTKMLVPSALKTFYIISLEDYSVRKNTVRVKSDSPLQYNGAWSADSKKVFFATCVYDTAECNLVIYNIDDFSYKKMPIPYLKVMHIEKLKSIDDYIILAMDESPGSWDLPPAYRLVILRDGQIVKNNPITISDDIFGINIFENSKMLCLDCYSKINFCDFDGVEIANPLKEFANKIPFENLEYFNGVCDFTKDISLILTNERIIAVNRKTLCFESFYIPYGVQKVIKINDNDFLAWTWDGIRKLSIEY